MISPQSYLSQLTTDELLALGDGQTIAVRTTVGILLVSQDPSETITGNEPHSLFIASLVADPAAETPAKRSGYYPIASSRQLELV